MVRFSHFCSHCTLLCPILVIMVEFLTIIGNCARTTTSGYGNGNYGTCCTSTTRVVLLILYDIIFLGAY
jgi:hypothetical protein